MHLIYIVQKIVGNTLLESYIMAERWLIFIKGVRARLIPPRNFLSPVMESDSQKEKFLASISVCLDW